MIPQIRVAGNDTQLTCQFASLATSPADSPLSSAERSLARAVWPSMPEFNLQLGDLIGIEFGTPSPARVTGIIRNRACYSFGFEFLIPLRAHDMRTDGKAYDFYL